MNFKIIEILRQLPAKILINANIVIDDNIILTLSSNLVYSFLNTKLPSILAIRDVTTIKLK